MRRVLAGVGVEAVEADIENARAEAFGDEAGDELELLREAVALPCHGVCSLQQFAQILDCRQRLHLAALHERRQVVVRGFHRRRRQLLK